MSRGGVPFTPRMWINNVGRAGRTIENDPGVIIKVASPAYHRALGIPLRRGRLFDESDYAGGPNAVIFNESAAKTYFPGEDPVGRAVNLNGAPAPSWGSSATSIIGVSRRRRCSRCICRWPRPRTVTANW